MADILNIHGDVGLSSGNGLWGPAASPVIFPDLQPTVEGSEELSGEVIISQPEAINGAMPQEAPVQVNPVPVKSAEFKWNATSRAGGIRHSLLGQSNNGSQMVQPAGYVPSARR